MFKCRDDSLLTQIWSVDLATDSTALMQSLRPVIWLRSPGADCPWLPVQRMRPKILLTVMRAR